MPDLIYVLPNEWTHILTDSLQNRVETKVETSCYSWKWGDWLSSNVFVFECNVIQVLNVFNTGPNLVLTEISELLVSNYYFDFLLEPLNQVWVHVYVKVKRHRLIIGKLGSSMAFFRLPAGNLSILFPFPFWRLMTYCVDCMFVESCTQMAPLFTTPHDLRLSAEKFTFTFHLKYKQWITQFFFFSM